MSKITKFTLTLLLSFLCVVAFSNSSLLYAFAEDESDDGLAEDSTATYVCEVDGVPFESFDDAIGVANASSEPSTVTLLQDIAITKSYKITGDVTIKGKYTIIRDDAYAGNMFNVAQPETAIDGITPTLTLDGGVVIDGNNNWSFDEEGFCETIEHNKNASTLKEVIFGSSTLVSEEGKLTATSNVFNVRSNCYLNINESTVQNNLGTYVIYNETDGNITLNDGALIRHNARTCNAVLCNLGLATIKDGATITDTYSYGGANGGAILCFQPGKLVMDGGVISKTRAIGCNGSVMMLQQAATFIMNGGEIYDNQALPNKSNGLCSAIYVHGAASRLEMYGGKIYENVGGYAGGIYAKRPESTVIIEGGEIRDNIACYTDVAADASLHDKTDIRLYSSNTHSISGGTFTQDVSVYCKSGYAVKEIEEGVYTVKQGFTATLNETANGTFALYEKDWDRNFDGKLITVGDQVEIKLSPNEGYVLDTITVMQDEVPVQVTDNVFTMPNADVTVTVTYKTCPHETYKDGVCSICGTPCPHNDFLDEVCTDCGASCPHDYHFIVNEYSITMHCEYGCEYTSTITLDVENDFVYDGCPHGVTVNGEIREEYTVTYNTDDGLKPILAGDYVATLTVDDASVSLGFTIALATLRIDLSSDNTIMPEEGVILSPTLYVNDVVLEDYSVPLVLKYKIGRGGEEFSQDSLTLVLPTEEVTGTMVFVCIETSGLEGKYDVATSNTIILTVSEDGAGWGAIYDWDTYGEDMNCNLIASSESAIFCLLPVFATMVVLLIKKRTRKNNHN